MTLLICAATRSCSASSQQLERYSTACHGQRPKIGYWAKGGRGGADLPASSNSHGAHLPMGLAPTRPTQLPYCPLALCTAHVHVCPLKLLTTTYAVVLLPLLAVAQQNFDRLDRCDSSVGQHVLGSQEPSSFCGKLMTKQLCWPHSKGSLGARLDLL